MPSSLKSILCCFRPTASAEGETSRATRHGDESAGSSPRASGMLAGLAPRHVLSDGECQLGGYLLDRQITGRPVEGQDFDRLIRAHETVMETRQALAYGRGNVTADIDDSNGQSTVRAEAGRRARGQIPRDYDLGVSVAASSLAAQAGNCGEHANVAAFLHAAKLQEGEEVCVVGRADHGWAELRGEHLGREHHVVMDSWGKGPAVFADDGAFSRNEHEVEVDRRYDRTTGAHAHAQMRDLQQRHGRGLQTEVRRQMDELGPDYRYPDDGFAPGRRLWPSKPVVSEQFAQAAVDRMIEEPNSAYFAPPPGSRAPEWASPVPTHERWMAPLRQEIHATETARTLGAQGLREATQAATRIADVALDLRGYPLPSHPAQFAPEDY